MYSELLKQINDRLRNLPAPDVNDYKSVYSHARRLEHLNREKRRLELQMELERVNSYPNY